MSATNIYMRMAAAGLALLPLLAAAPAAMADNKSLGGYSTWTGAQKYPGHGPKGRKHGYLHAVCVDPSYSGYGDKRHRQYTVTSIEAAMHAVAPGGVIEVKPGAVAENLVIYKPVELRAGDCYRRMAPPARRGWDHYMQPAYTHLKEMLRPALVSEHGKPCVAIRTRGRVIISGFRLGAVTHGKGVCVYQTRGELLMSDNVVHGVRGGTSVYVRNGALWMISNTLRGGRIGVDISSRVAQAEPRVFIHRNRIVGMSTGILVRSDVPVEISQNRIANTYGAGIRLLSGQADIRSNIISENSGSGLMLEGEDQVHVADNKFVFNRTAVSSAGYGLNVDNFRFNHVSCNEAAGVRRIPTNTIAHNPAERRGWFSRRKQEEIQRYCSELVHSPIRLGMRDEFAGEAAEEGGYPDDGFSGDDGPGDRFGGDRYSRDRYSREDLPE